MAKLMPKKMNVLKNEVRVNARCYCISDQVKIPSKVRDEGKVDIL